MLRDDSLKRLKKGQQDSLRGLIRPDSLERQKKNLMPEYDEFNIKSFKEDINNEMMPHINHLADEKLEAMESQIMGRDQHAGLKKGFFSMIDNVLGGGQSSTTQMANNMSLIQSNLSNVSMVSNQ